MNLPKIKDIDVKNKRVLLRLDLDTVPDENDLRIKSSIETLDYLKDQSAEIVVLAHKGRPDGKVDESLSLKPFQTIFDKWGARVEENLRFDPGEEKNDPEYSKKLASMGDVYINEAFASSHRNHASIVGITKLLPHAFGFRFIQEIENLTRVFEDPKRPLVFLISGVKEDKLEFVKKFESIADKILLGGRLPDFLGDEALVSVRSRRPDEKVIVGNLIMDKEDITLNTIDVFEKIISSAGTVVVSGPLGKYEEDGHKQGTEKILNAVVKSSAFKVAGGGDTEKALDTFGLLDKFDWVSVGGGAMLEFLADKTLSAINALNE